jgi:hypothetical protein
MASANQHAGASQNPIILSDDEDTDIDEQRARKERDEHIGWCLIDYT